jgi:hypothetical protein
MTALINKPFMYVFALLTILLTFVTAGRAYGADTEQPSVASDEEREIAAAARQYLDAEVARKLKAVYECLAPSSIYRASHNYDAYLTEAEASPVRIREYQILRITNIRINDDKKTYPRVEKFAQVEVDMQIYFIDTQKTADVNFNFTFIREDGRWYKG